MGIDTAEGIPLYKLVQSVVFEFGEVLPGPQIFGRIGRKFCQGSALAFGNLRIRSQQVCQKKSCQHTKENKNNDELLYSLCCLCHMA